MAFVKLVVLLALLAVCCNFALAEDTPRNDRELREGLPRSLRGASAEDDVSIELGDVSLRRLNWNQVINTAPTPKPYGTCKGQNLNSGWCSKGVLPGGPSKPTLKYGRHTLYGSVGGTGWCGKKLVGGAAVPVAIGTRYIPTSTISPKSPYCGKCMCIRINGADPTSNQYPPAAAKKYYGKVFKGVVMDLCPECEQDHIDILTDKPYTSIVPLNMAYTVGVWTVSWNFVSCATDCNAYMK